MVSGLVVALDGLPSLTTRYHRLDATRLARLHQLTRRDLVKHYAKTWHGYTERWPEMPVCDGVEMTRRP